MSDNSKIEWTDATWNPVRGCTKISPGCFADRMAAMLQGKLREAGSAAHIWWGVSVENHKHGLPRVAKLRGAKPTVAFLSVEPLLEDLGKMDLRGIHWVIVGELFGSKELHDSSHYESLRDRYVAKTHGLVLQALESKRRLPYDDAWTLALSESMCWESDLKEWIAPLALSH